ncbi:hypothetical protein FQR65_LT02210 [Abscondita terminalis]|nr:hypothetical protein FQR65_LT02210 [Abscondita terminalis]
MQLFILFLFEMPPPFPLKAESTLYCKPQPWGGAKTTIPCFQLPYFIPSFLVVASCDARTEQKESFDDIPRPSFMRISPRVSFSSPKQNLNECNHDSLHNRMPEDDFHTQHRIQTLQQELDRLHLSSKINEDIYSKSKTITVCEWGLRFSGVSKSCVLQDIYF